MDTQKILLLLVGAGLIMFAIGWLTASICASTEDDIRAWAEERGKEVDSVKVHFTPIGTPYWYLQNGAQIYEVTMTDGEKDWIRTSILGWDITTEPIKN